MSTKMRYHKDMLSNLLNLDSQISISIAYFFPHNWFFDIVFSFLSLQGVYIVFWIAAMGFLLLIDGKKRRLEFILLLISLTVTILSVNLLKGYFQRPRPWTLLNPQDIRCYERDFSFPSGHAAGAMSGAVILAVAHKKKRYWYYGLAVLIALSRIYWQCHYLLDIIAGASLGYFISRITLHVSTYSIAKPEVKKS